MSPRRLAVPPQGLRHFSPLRVRVDFEANFEELTVSSQLQQSALDFMDKDPFFRGVVSVTEDNPENFIELSAELVSKASRKQHLTALTFVYVLWLRSPRHPRIQEYIITLARRSKKSNKKVTSLRLLVEAIITYGENTSEDRKAKRGLYSRDVAALTYLHHLGVEATKIADFAAKPGQGLNHWARQWADVKKASKLPVMPSAQLKGSICVTIRRTDECGKAIVERHNLACCSEVNSYLEKIEMLPKITIPTSPIKKNSGRSALGIQAASCMSAKA